MFTLSYLLSGQLSTRARWVVRHPETPQTGTVKVFLKLALECEPDAAWRALQSPAVFQEVSSPLLQMEPLNGAAFPTRWEPGGHRMRVRFAGLLPLGEQVTSLEFSTHEHPGVRVLRDRGYGATGVLSLNHIWDHRMAVSAHPSRENMTLYRDRLVVGAGLMTPVAWAALWSFWQLRAANLRRLAPTWSYTPPSDGGVSN